MAGLKSYGSQTSVHTKLGYIGYTNFILLIIHEHNGNEQISPLPPSYWFPGL